MTKNLLNIATIILVGIFATVSVFAEDTLAIEHVTLIDGTGQQPLAAMTVVTSDGVIKAVGADGSIDIPNDAQRINGSGQFLIPGMMDLHLHLMGGGVYRASRTAENKDTIDFEQGTRLLQSYLYYGFTTVLDVGNNHKLMMPLPRGYLLQASNWHPPATRSWVLVQSAFATGLIPLKTLILLFRVTLICKR